MILQQIETSNQYKVLGTAEDEMEEESENVVEERKKRHYFVSTRLVKKLKI